VLELNEEQQRALAGSPEVPARVVDADTGQTVVLLEGEDCDWIRGLLKDEPDAPRVVDPRTQKTYALVPEQRYERFKAFFEEDPLSEAERRSLLREAGRRAGWDDPSWEAAGTGVAGRGGIGHPPERSLGLRWTWPCGWIGPSSTLELAAPCGPGPQDR
jgi:hypothetical protein